MAEFNGNNNIGSVIDAFFEKINFKLNAYNNTTNIQDMNFAEWAMYGRVDTNLNTVLPLVNTLKPINNSFDVLDTKLAMNFVADAFHDLMNLFQMKLSLGQIPQNELYLSTLMVKQAYTNPIEEYRLYISNIFDIYMDEYLPARNFTKEIMSIDDFIEYFLMYVKVVTSHVPITFTAWHRSNNSSPFSSGIVLNVAPHNHDDDNAKFSTIISRPTFAFYVNACMQHGFMVSEDNPSVLFADLDSPAMLPYIQNYNLSNPASVFKNQFELVYNIDIAILDTMFLQKFNTFVNRNKFNKQEKYCILTNKIKYELMARNNISLSDYNININNKKKILMYIKLRNIEENFIFPGPDLERIKRRALFLEKKVDIDKAMGYINEQFRSTFRFKPGGINWVSKWLSKRDMYKKLEG